MTGILYYQDFVQRNVRQERFGRWPWSITDGMTGPRLAAGAARTERGAIMALAAAEARCKRRIPGVPLHELTCAELTAIADELAREHDIPVLPSVGDDHVLHLQPLRAVSVHEETVALRAFIRATDARVAWHPTETATEPAL